MLLFGVWLCSISCIPYYYMALRYSADRIGFDPWDVHLTYLREMARIHEQAPTSRYWFGSPCRFVRVIDFAVHVWLPAAISERHPYVAAYLRTTSPRWGRAWRGW